MKVEHRLVDLMPEIPENMWDDVIVILRFIARDKVLRCHRASGFQDLDEEAKRTARALVARGALSFPPSVEPA